MSGIVDFLRGNRNGELSFFSNASRDGLYMMALGSLVFILLGAALEGSSSLSPVDFRVPYYNTRCLLRHCDPYNETDVLRIYEAEGGKPDLEPGFRSIPFMYPPSFFSITAPFAVLPVSLALTIWNVLTYGSLIAASFLIWFFASQNASKVSGCLIGFMVANSECLAMVGNPAGVAISLGVVAVLCFLCAKFETLGVASLGLALLIKPHDVGFIWLYFLLAGGTYRKRSLQALVVATVVGRPAFLWVAHVAPHWMEELRTTIRLATVHGGPNDPGPASSGAHGLGMMVNLQTALSFFRDDPAFYNPLTYAICFGLLGAWAFCVIQSRATYERAWLAVAAVSALTMLPVYHRQYDTRLLLLTVPACARLWAEGGRTGKVAMALTLAAFAINGDLFWAAIFVFLRSFHIPATYSKVVVAAQMLPAPLVLLALGAFYLSVFAHRTHRLELA